jgi:hypothetical protein
MSKPSSNIIKITFDFIVGIMQSNVNKAMIELSQ